MNLSQIEEIMRFTNLLAEKLTPYPASILKNQFKQFYNEVDKTLQEIVFAAYKNGELKSVVDDSTREKP